MAVSLKKKSDRRIFDREWRLQNLYMIRREDRTLGKLVLNEVQRELFAYAKSVNFRGVRDIDLKGRKPGVSTFWLLFYLDDTLFNPNTTTGIIAHRREDVNKLFNIVKLAYRACPSQIELSNGKIWYKPKANYDNKGELRFEDTNSAIYVALESRGETNNNLHISEAAHIKDENKIKATLASVPNITFGSNISVESTANGMGGWFQETCMAAETGHSNFMLHFFSWFFVVKNAIPAPEGWEPDEEALKMKTRVLERCGVELTRAQLFWWTRTKSEQGRLMDQEFPTFLEDAFLASGSMAFDEDRVRAIQPKKPIRSLRIKVDGRQYDADIYVEPNPKRRYVAGGDPAEGVGGDRSTCEIVDTLTLEQVAEFVSNKIPPADFAVVVDNLCRLYNMALAVPERNNHGHLVIDRLKDTYSNIYTRVVLDEKTNKKTKKLGWQTDSHTRDLILDELDDLIREGALKINSGIMKEEMLTFIVNEDGKREAKSGKHDDTIMALAIALKVARLPRSSFVFEKVS